MGKPVSSAAPTVENPFQFAGQYTDAKTGLQDLRARYYDPATGQFLSRDPLEDTTLHPYAYADNDPTNATDPSGLSVLSTVSDAAAGTLDGLTGGYSTKLAASLLDFNLDCAHFGAGFSALRTAAFVGSLADGEGELALVARLGIKETQAAKAGEEGLEGLSRSYIDIAKGGSIRNVGTNATHTEFAGGLTGAGWASRTSKDGAVQIFSKDGAKYVLRERAGSHAGWTADFTASGASDVTLKIRLGHRP
jgi:RHS repeat-associated protein